MNEWIKKYFFLKCKIYCFIKTRWKHITKQYMGKRFINKIRTVALLHHEQEIHRRHFNYQQSTLLSRIWYFMGQHVILCACVHTPFSAGIGSYCYLSSCLVPEFPAFSPEVAALHQDCCLHREFNMFYSFCSNWSLDLLHSKSQWNRPHETQ
jgi:hypothetical protein